MEDLFSVLNIFSNLEIDLEKIRKGTGLSYVLEDGSRVSPSPSHISSRNFEFNQHFEELDQLFGNEAPVSDVSSTNSQAHNKGGTSVTPQQTKKRAKRLTSLTEVDSNESTAGEKEASMRSSVRISNNKLMAVVEDEINNTATLMPPPPAPTDTTLSMGRPQRAAKLRSEKNLKEPSLGTKLRRPTTEVPVKVKLEHEQRPSQSSSVNSSQTVVASAEEKTQVNNEKSLADVNIDDQQAGETNISKSLRVKVKREKLSDGSESACAVDVNATATTHSSNSTSKVPMTEKATKPNVDESTILSTTTAGNTTTASVASKKGRKKHHCPIKVERFSDLDKNSPISSRTRIGNTSKRNSQESQAPQRSLYEDAVEGISSEAVARPECVANADVLNGTVTIVGATTVSCPAPPDETFVLPSNSDATFAVAKENSLSSDKSMETANDGTIPQPNSDSLMTEDESLVDQAAATKALCKLPIEKPMKMPTRTHELFNPLLQSPVKMRVEAFENAANGQKGIRSKRTKELAGTPGSNTTPIIGKLQAPTLGRFLTPTQSSIVAPLSSALPKKAPMSACKATSLLKTSTATSLKAGNSNTGKTMSRENSGEDFRKGLHQLAEERKKQREQKHLLAAQQREAKERERAERMAKLAKEREEKRLKKLEENERKKQEMEKQQRKLLQHDEVEALKKAKAKEQEHEILQQIKLKQENQIKSKQMMPPPPKSEYTFEMLHEDDSTDDEGKVSYKRPPAPSWSRSDVRGASISMQSHCPTDVIDSFFSVAPTTIDLKDIFPDIDPRHLKRNSSVLWSTPPRYSELPKY